MRGVVVICFMFLVFPGLEAAQDVAASTVQPSSDKAVAEPVVPIANVTESTKLTSTATATTTMVPNTSVTTSTTMVPNTSATTSTTMATNTSVTTSTTMVPNTSVTTSTTMVPNTSATTSTTMATNTSVTTSTTMATNTSATTSTTMVPNTSATTSTTMATNTSATSATASTSMATNTSAPASTSMATNTSAPANSTMAPETGTSEIPKTSLPVPEYCAPGVCGNGSTCLQLYQTYECQCPLNYQYDTSGKTCRGGDSFFGEFTINGVNFNSNPESQEYTELYNKVINQSEASLSGLSGYLGTVILQISLIPSKSETRSRRSTGNVSAKVSHMFTKGATNADEVTKELQANTGGFAVYNSKSICDGFYCDAETTQCEATPDGQGATCTCKDGKYSSSAVQTVTTCRDCDPKCYTTEGKYCNLESQTGPKCECRPGYKSNGAECQICDFGYSGVECADNFLFILVIVGAVLGAAVVALLGAVIGVSVRSKKGKKYEDSTALIMKDETAFGGGSPATGRIFPKVQAKTDLGEVNKAANVYEDNEEYTRNFPKRDYDENPWYEMDKKTRNY